MHRIWRISNYADLEGLGGLKAGQRWHTRGRRIVYCAPSPAAAIQIRLSIRVFSE